MASEKDLKINISVGGDAAKSVKTLRAEMRELQETLITAKEGTEEYNKALSRLASIKDKMQDVNVQAKTLMGTGEALHSVSNSLIGSFQTLTGAMQIFGSENKELASTLSKMQGFLNLAQGIQSVKDLGLAFNALKISLLTNPIFIVVATITAIGVALYALKDKVAAITSLFNGLGKAFSFIVDTLKDIGDAVGIYNKRLEQLEQSLKGIENLHDKEIEQLEREKQVQQALGQDTFELEKKKIELLQDRLRKQIALLEAIAKERELTEEEQKQLNDFTKQFKDNQTQLTILQINEQKRLEEERKKAHEAYIKRLKERKEAEEKASQEHIESEKKTTETLIKNIDEYTNYAIKQAKLLGENTNQIELDALNEKKVVFKNEIDRLEEQKRNKIKIDEEYLAELKSKYTDTLLDIALKQQAITNEMNEQRLASLKESFDKEIAINQENFGTQIQLAEIHGQDTFNLRMQQLNELLQLKEFEIGQLEILEMQGVDAAVKEKQRLVDEVKKINTQILIEQEKQKQKEIQIEQQKTQAKIQAGKAMLSSVTSLTQNFFTLQKNMAEGDVKRQKEIARQAFNANKALSIVNATINTAEGVTKALAAYPPPFNAIAAGITAAAGAIQIAAIASQQFNENAGGAASSATAASQPSAPSADFNPNTQQSNALQPLTPQGFETDKLKHKDNMEIKSIVVETDIRSTQDRVNAIRESAAF